jgi:hypothetical protein
MKQRALLGALVVILANGCDPATGVVRTVGFTNTLSNDKIEAALRDVVGEKGFEHKTEGYLDVWLIRKGGGGVVLEVEELKKGEKTLQLQSVRLGSSSTFAEQTDTRRLMDDIYVSLRNHAPDLPEPGAVHEKLIRVRK